MGWARARPGENFGQEFFDESLFVGRLFGLVRGIVGVVGLVPEVPGEDAGVVGEGADNPFYIDFEAWVLRGIGESGAAGTLHPA